MVNSTVPLAVKILQWYKNPLQFYEDMFGHPPFEYQERMLLNWIYPESHKRVIALSAAGTGKTELLAGTALFFGIVLSDERICKLYDYLRKGPHEVIILSGSLRQSRNVYAFIRNALLRSTYSADLIKKRELRQSDTQLSNGAVIKALPCSLTATQGQHGYVIIVDEAALVPDFQLDDCYRIIGAHNGIMLWSGTPTTYESKFVRIFEEEVAKITKGQDSLWEIFTWAASECPLLQDAYEEAKRTLPEHMIQIFWEGKPFPLIGTLIPADAMVEAVRGISRFDYDPTWHTVFGVDWGWGHPTALVIMQTNGDRYYCLEAHEWAETDFDSIHDIIDAKAQMYTPKRIFCDISHKGENLRLMKRGLPIFEVAFSKEKAMMQGRLRDLFVKRKIKIPDVDSDSFQSLAYELRTYTWEKKENDDLVDAMQLATKDFLPKDSDSLYIASAKPRRRRRRDLMRR